MGIPPRRIDVLTELSGVVFSDAWPRRIQAQFGRGVTCDVIGAADLVTNKTAAGRTQDLADVEALDRLGRR